MHATFTSQYRSSRYYAFWKKYAFKNFAKFIAKHSVCLFFKKVAGCGPATLLNKKLRHRCDKILFLKHLLTNVSRSNRTKYLLFIFIVGHDFCVSKNAGCIYEKKISVPELF